MSGAPPAELAAVCFDANDPRRLARFWAAALRWDLDDTSGELALVPSDRVGLRILFQRVPEPKAQQNRIHFDLTTTSIDDQTATVARLLELGGRHVDIGQRPAEAHVVLADPEGNELCVIEPSNNFLGDCGRLGAINCDGTRATGLFWSAALGWPLVWDQDEETAIRSPDPDGPMITWSGPPLMPKPAKNRVHLHVAPSGPGGIDAAVARLVELGGRLAADGPSHAGHAGRVVMTDPDDNEFCVVT